MVIVYIVIYIYIYIIYVVLLRIFSDMGGGAENLVYGSLSSSFMAFLCVLQ